MSNESYLSKISCCALWESYFSYVCATSFRPLEKPHEVELPDKTKSFIKSEAKIFSAAVESCGFEIGSKYKSFRGNKAKAFDTTRLNPEDISEIWFSSIVPKFKDRINASNSLEFGSTDNSRIPGIESLTRDDFWRKSRNIAFNYWQKHFDLYKDQETKNELKVS